MQVQGRPSRTVGVRGSFRAEVSPEDPKQVLKKYLGKWKCVLGMLWVDLAGSSYWETLISVSLVLLFPRPKEDSPNILLPRG